MTKQAEQRGYLKLVTELTALRRRGQDAELELLLKLIDLPNTHKEILEHHHEGPVYHFLKDKPEVYDIRQFSLFSKGFEFLNVPTVKAIGHDMVIALGRTEDENKVQDAVTLAKGYVKQHSTYPNARKAYSFMVQSGARSPKMPSKEKYTTTQLLLQIEELRAENKRLKAELKNAQRELRKKTASTTQTSKRRVAASA